MENDVADLTLVPQANKYTWDNHNVHLPPNAGAP